MAFADKYQKSVTEMTDKFLKQKKTLDESLKKIEDEERRKKAEWAAKRAKLESQASEYEKLRLNSWGATVIATGFVDAYETEFSLLTAIIKYGMDKLKNDPHFREELLPYMKPSKKSTKAVKPKSKAPQVEIGELPPEDDSSFDENVG